MKQLQFGALVVISLVFAAASPARAALLVNGGFETGTFTGWTLFTTANGSLGHAPPPDVALFDTTGSGSSLAARFQVGQVVSSSVPAGGGIFQSVLLSTGTLTINLDIAAEENNGTGNASGGLFELLLDGVVVASNNFGSIGANAVERASLSYSTGVLAGSHEIRVLMTRNFTTGSGIEVTPFQFVDNVRLSGTSVSDVVPEPSSLILAMGLTICAGSFSAARRRRAVPKTSDGEG